MSALVDISSLCDKTLLYLIVEPCTYYYAPWLLIVHSSDSILK